MKKYVGQNSLYHVTDKETETSQYEDGFIFDIWTTSQKALDGRTVGVRLVTLVCLNYQNYILFLELAKLLLISVELTTITAITKGEPTATNKGPVEGKG